MYNHDNVHVHKNMYMHGPIHDPRLDQETTRTHMYMYMLATLTDNWRVIGAFVIY